MQKITAQFPEHGNRGLHSGTDHGIRVRHGILLSVSGCCLTVVPDPDGGGALAFDLLRRVSGLVDLPEVLVKAQQALHKTRSVESRQAAAFLDQYFEERNLPPDDDTVSELLSLASGTCRTGTSRAFL